MNPSLHHLCPLSLEPVLSPVPDRNPDNDWQRSNLLLNTPVRHRYLGQRHGLTRANQDSRYVGDEHDNLFLSQVLPEGKMQTRHGIIQSLETGLINRDTIIVCSDYIRSLQSALAAAEVLDSERVLVTPLLRERGCGNLKGDWRKIHPRVAEMDRIDPGHQTWGVESLCSVTERFTRLVMEMERKFSTDSHTFLFATHCEVIQIGVSAFAGIHPGRYMDAGLPANGEVIQLNRSTSGLHTD